MLDILAIVWYWHIIENKIHQEDREERFKRLLTLSYKNLKVVGDSYKGTKYI